VEHRSSLSRSTCASPNDSAHFLDLEHKSSNLHSSQYMNCTKQIERRGSRGLTFVQGGERLPTVVVAGGEMDSHGEDLGRNRAPDGEGKGGRGEELRERHGADLGRRRSGRRWRKIWRWRRHLPLSPPVAFSVTRESEGFRSRPTESWIALPGKRVERPGSIQPINNQMAQWAEPGQLDPCFLRPGKTRGSPRDRVQPNKPLEGRGTPEFTTKTHHTTPNRLYKTQTEQTPLLIITFWKLFLDQTKSQISSFYSIFCLSTFILHVSSAHPQPLDYRHSGTQHLFLL
jgi:hypothetical protein